MPWSRAQKREEDYIYKSESYLSIWKVGEFISEDEESRKNSCNKSS